MRKLFLLLVFIASFSGLFAQKIEDIQKDMKSNKYPDAKAKIDKFLSDPANQNNAQGWYLKGKIYTQLTLQDSTGTSTDNSRIAFDAFKKYQELDPKNTFMLIEQNMGLFQLYETYYNKGAKAYNSKDYKEAFENLSQADSVEQYIGRRGYSYNTFKVPVLDTQLLYLTGNSAYLLKKQDTAVTYWQRVADSKVNGADYKNMYALLIQYYINKGDQANADKYLSLGKQLYPDENYWLGIEIGDVGSGKTALPKYEKLLQKYPDNYALNMDYAIELFNELYTGDKRPQNYAEEQEKLSKALSKAISIKSTAIANFVMSQHIYNEIFDIDDAARAIKGNTPADAAKRREFNTKRDAKYNEMYPYAQKAYDLYSAETNLKVQDKANFRKTINELIDYYERKKQNDKVAFYQGKLKSI